VDSGAQRQILPQIDNGLLCLFPPTQLPSLEGYPNVSEFPESETPPQSEAIGEPDSVCVAEPLPEEAFEPIHTPPPPPRTVAPLWHTALLVALIVAVSILGATQRQRLPSHTPLLAHYAATATLEIVIVLWGLLGLRLGHTRLRSIFGRFPITFPAIAREVGVSAIFWLASMFILGSVALTWTTVETKIYEAQIKHDQQVESAENTPQNGPAKSPEKPPKAPPHRQSPQEKQLETSRALMTMAPTTLAEGIAWGLLCVLVGFSEEFVFRGYFMAQGISFLRSVPIGVLFSALVFGAAHGYEGARGMVVIGVYGALFSILALLRRSLFPGMVAHAWHDFSTGLLLAFLRSSHLLDNLPKN